MSYLVTVGRDIFVGRIFGLLCGEVNTVYFIRTFILFFVVMLGIDFLVEDDDGGVGRSGDYIDIYYGLSFFLIFIII